jgi:hypothetical protein
VLSRTVERTDIEGTWTGIIYEANARGTVELRFTLTLEQGEDNFVGRTRIEDVANPDYYALMQIEAFVFEDLFFFVENEIVEQNRHPQLSWCLKVAELNMIYAEDRSLAFLYGPLRGQGCQPGVILLRRTVANL